MDKGAEKIVLRTINEEPLFRIGLFDGQEHIDFKVMGKFSVQDREGNDLIKKIDSDLKWRVKTKEAKPGKDRYFLILYESFDKASAEGKLKAAQQMDSSAVLSTLGGEVYLENRLITNNTRYIISAGNYPSEMSARKDFKRFQPDFIPFVEKESIKAPQGQLEVFDAEYDKSAEADSIVRIIPEKIETPTKIFGVRSYNDILQKESFTDLVFNGIIEFRFDVHGSLMAISEVPLEIYLRRVIYSEIGTDLPYEFCKSLAITCRSEAISRIRHRRLGDPFDYCNTGETLRYFGDEFIDENIDKAVLETRGLVIVGNNGVLDTPFHLISGGHTEDGSGLRESPTPTFFEGKYNKNKVPKSFKPLANESAVKEWIHSRPDTWCNLKGRQLPPALEKVKKYFRWEVNYSRKELEDIVRKKSGEDIGILFEIIPILRGCSGRLKELELIGSLKNYRIRGQLNIRESLSHDYLPSSCFLVERELDETGTPISFTMVGAGHGHGIGMCKTGAAVMAMEGFKSDAILKHYYGKFKITSIYDGK